ncbi:Importin [Tolypocladium capitatum]|uniref:Importin n=1 Tax=Tolypocladium capitatum TaxID=45235 RepID=A0A2K3QNX0_9HYPO|nr:Importin [Tolypocladium capitatum]
MVHGVSLMNACCSCPMYLVWICILSSTRCFTSPSSISMPRNAPCVASNPYALSIAHMRASSSTPSGIALGMLQRNEKVFNPGGFCRASPVPSTCHRPSPAGVVRSVSAMKSRPSKSRTSEPGKCPPSLMASAPVPPMSVSVSVTRTWCFESIVVQGLSSAAMYTGHLNARAHCTCVV